MKVRKSLQFLLGILTGVLDLIYPRTCAACIRSEPVRGGIFCIQCLTSLSFTDTHLIRNDLLEKHFWGRVNFEWGMAMLYLVPGGVAQKMMYQIKYRGRKEFAEEIGIWYGQKMKEGSRYEPVDFIVPVPLHWRKLQKRGYNQSLYFAKGLSKALGVPYNAKNLIRLKFTSTQTRKSRLERMENMKSAFQVQNHGLFSNKHILLVDDVMTTGATFEACALEILKCKQVKLSFATIAMGRL